FGPGESNQTPLTGVNSYDIFHAKYNSDGTLQWAKSDGGAGGNIGISVAALPDGSAIEVGVFGDSVTFGLGGDNPTPLTSAGDYDIYIAKYNSDGTLAWAKRAGGDSEDNIPSISTLSDGSFLLSGLFRGTMIVGPGETLEIPLTSAGNDEIFLAKYNSDGTPVWAKRAGGTDRDWVNAIAAVSDGSTLMTGMFKGTATFGPGEPGETSLTAGGAPGAADIFVAKYNPDGTLAGVKTAGGNGTAAWNNEGKGIDALPDGSALVTGAFEQTGVFGAGEARETSLVAQGIADMFVAKFRPFGDGS
ncbi:MAG: hypothetical protein GY854_31375, partial [Deltaproteobacteria bacterium]|nr:hypothetical protein [Deltaproteobacteria bacterium]